MSNEPMRITKKDIVEGLKFGHEYEWIYEGIKYSLLPTWSKPAIYFCIEGSNAKSYNSIDEIIKDGYDLVKMMDNNPELYEY